MILRSRMFFSSRDAMHCRVPRIVAIAFFLILLLGVQGSSVALAHALLLRSDPTQDALLQRAPAEVHLWFSEDLNGSASRIVVWNRYRHVMNIGTARLVPGQSRQLEVPLKTLKPGSYLVLWTSVSSEDGHVLRGSYLFSVKIRGPGPSLAGVSLGGTAQTFPDAPTMTSLLAHWLELLSAIVWAGVVAFSAIVFSPRSARLEPSITAMEQVRTRALVRIALVVLVLASCVVLAMQAYGLAGNSWNGAFSGSALSEVFSVQYGQLWIVRQVIALLALGTTFLPARGALSYPYKPAIDAGERGSLALASPPLTLLVFLYLIMFAASGHAAAARVGNVLGSHIVSLAVLMDLLHFVGTSLWFGGQVYIALVLIPVFVHAGNWQRNARPFLDILDRFSPVAYLSIGLFTVTGPFNGAIHIPSWYAFFNSVYGRALIAKIVLIGLMLLTSAFTVYLLRPRLRALAKGAEPNGKAALGTLLRRLHRFLHVEPVLGIGVLLATSVMFYYPVPAGFAPSGPSAYLVRGGGLSARIKISPDRSGPNTITVTLHNSGGQPVQRASVAVLTTMLDMVMGTGTAAMKETAPGTFVGTTDLGMGGHWRFQLLVYQPSGLTRMSVDVQVGT